jgi:aspartate-semialdehyde dehydrogenase
MEQHLLAHLQALQERFAFVTAVRGKGLLAAMEFDGDLAGRELPSAPHRLITVHDDPFRPQPRLDRDADGGMTTSVGRIREDPALERGIKYVLVSHNTKMGAAKGAVLTAEYLATAGYI